MLLAVAAAAGLAPGPLSAQRPAAATTPSAPAVAVANDQQRPAGRMVDGELQVELEAVAATWSPRGTNGAAVATPAFAEVGRAPELPGPLLRTTVGTPVRVRVHNRLERPIAERGLLDRIAARARRPGWAPPAAPDFLFADSLVVPPGQWREVRFTPSEPVSSFYYGRVAAPAGAAVPPHEIPGGDASEGGFLGALVVDPRGAPPSDERVFVLTRWGGDDPRTREPTWRMLVNGRSWPATERLEYTVGDTVRWRVINTTLTAHPMHLHGFYFRVEADGDTQRDVARAAGAQLEVVTERMPEISARRLVWVAERPGNWLFHCHLIRHMGATQRFLDGAPDAAPPAGAHADAHGEMDGMAGMITGITIHPRPGARPAEAPPARRIDLWTGRRANVFGDQPELGFVVQAGRATPAADSVLVPGSPLVLHRGEPTAIVVHNRLHFPLSLHWHGMELRSEYDGVGHWSGRPGATRAPVAPGDSQRVVLAPPRAGTFFYHTHGEPGHELTQGLYGPLLVLEPGERWDRERDRVFVLGSRGATIDAPPAINGREQPESERFAVGASHRLRLIQISADEVKHVRLTRDGEPVRWQPLAKDGADLPAAQQAPGPAAVTLGVGEAFDARWTPDAPGVYVLEVRTAFYPNVGGAVEQRVAFGVGEVSEAALRAAADGSDREGVALSPSERRRYVGSYVGRVVVAPDPREWLFAVWEEEGRLVTTTLARGESEAPPEPITAAGEGVFHPGGRMGERLVPLREEVRLRFVGSGTVADSLVVEQDGQTIVRFARRDTLALTAAERARVVGRYAGAPLPAPAVLREEGGTLVLETPGQPLVALRPLTPTRFLVEGPAVPPGATLHVELVDGEAAALVVRPAPGAPPLRLPRVRD